jgi:hypothetical protein
MTEAELPSPFVGPVGGGTDLAITAISGDGSAVVRLSGELDLSTAPRARSCCRVLEIAELGWLIDPGRTELPGAHGYLASVNP